MAAQNNRTMATATVTTSVPHFNSRSSSVISDGTNSSGTFAGRRLDRKHNTSPLFFFFFRFFVQWKHRVSVSATGSVFADSGISDGCSADVILNEIHRKTRSLWGEAERSFITAVIIWTHERLSVAQEGGFEGGPMSSEAEVPSTGTMMKIAWMRHWTPLLHWQLTRRLHGPFQISQNF